MNTQQPMGTSEEDFVSMFAIRREDAINLILNEFDSGEDKHPVASQITDRFFSESDTPHPTDTDLKIYIMEHWDDIAEALGYWDAQ